MRFTRIAIPRIVLATLLIAGFIHGPNAQAQKVTPAPPAQASSTVRPVQQEHQLRMEYERWRIPRPILRLGINGHKPLPFLVDTVTSWPLIIMPWAAKVLDLKPTGKKLNTQALMDVKSLECVLAKEEDNHKTIPFYGNYYPIVLDLPGMDEMAANDRIAGMFGIRGWQKLTVGFDFQAQSLILMEGSHPPSASPYMVILPLKEKGDSTFYIPVQDLQGQSVDFLLNIGSPFTQLPQKYVARFGARMTSTTQGIGGMSFAPQVEKMAVLDALHLGNKTTSQVELTVPSGKDSSIEATLGMNVLSRYRMTIDFPAKKVYLEPAADYEKQARLPGLQVTHVQKHGSQIQIDIVWPGSAAYRAGLRDEDRLLAVDGVLVAGLPTTIVEDMMNGFSSTDAQLRVERSGQIHEIVYHRYSLADDIIGAPLGVEASMTDDYRMIIDTVAKGSPAQKAGLHKGDSILIIGGLAVQATDNERLQSLLKNPPTSPLMLTVQRKGADHSEEIKLAW